MAGVFIDLAFIEGSRATLLDLLDIRREKLAIVGRVPLERRKKEKKGKRSEDGRSGEIRHAGD